MYRVWSGGTANKSLNWSSRNVVCAEAGRREELRVSVRCEDKYMRMCVGLHSTSDCQRVGREATGARDRHHRNYHHRDKTACGGVEVGNQRESGDL